MEFDPYRQWLRITDEERPPNHYALLGLSLFESDHERIRDAFYKRYEEVRRYQVGEHGDAAVELLEELSHAYRELTSPSDKAAYDEQFGGAMPMAEVAELPVAEQAMSETVGNAMADTKTKGGDWSAIEAMLRDARRATNDSMLARGEALAARLDPVHGKYRFAQLAMRNGLQQSRFRESLEHRAKDDDKTVCGECFELIPPPPVAHVPEVRITEDGDVLADMCRIRAKSKLLWTFFTLDTAWGPWWGATPDASISRRGALLITAALSLAPPLLVMPILLLEGGPVSLMFAAFGVLGLVAMVCVYLMYRPRLSKPLDVAWEEIAPQLLDAQPSRDTAGFLVGLLRAAGKQHPPKAASLRRAIQKLRLWTAYHDLPYEYLAELYQYDLIQRSEGRDGTRAAMRVLDEIVESVVRERLPVALFDAVLRDGELLSLLPLAARAAFAARAAHLALDADLMLPELLELARVSPSFAELWGEDEERRAEWLAGLQSIYRFKSSQLAVLQLDRVFELVEQNAVSTVASWPRLLAVSKDRSVAIGVDGVYFGGTCYSKAPVIDVQPIVEWVESHTDVPGHPNASSDGGYERVVGYALVIDGKTTPYPTDPSQQAAVLKQLTRIYCDQIRRGMDTLLSQPRELRWNRWDSIRRVVCPRCGVRVQFQTGRIAETIPTLTAG
ncbi:MAG: hypothetical protein KDA71_20240 [Planctomycetales bacterium]|nr:hypothetical protein [Planctomycetales bacterium]